MARCVGRVLDNKGERIWGYVADLGVEYDDIFLEENAYLGNSVRRNICRSLCQTLQTPYEIYSVGTFEKAQALDLGWSIADLYTGMDHSRRKDVNYGLDQVRSLRKLIILNFEPADYPPDSPGTERDNQISRDYTHAGAVTFLAIEQAKRGLGFIIVKESWTEVDREWFSRLKNLDDIFKICLLYTSPSPRD